MKKVFRIILITLLVLLTVLSGKSVSVSINGSGGHISIGLAHISLNVMESRASASPSTTLVLHSGFETHISANAEGFPNLTGSSPFWETISHTGTYSFGLGTIVPAAGNYISTGTTSNRLSVWIRAASVTNTNAYIIGDSTNAGIFLDASGYLDLYTSGTKRIDGTTLLPEATWVRVSYSYASASDAKYYINGNIEGTLSANATVISGQIGPTAQSAVIRYDDFAMDSAASSADLGDIRVALAFPNAAGTYADFDTRVSVAEPNHHQNIDDVPNSVNDSDYNQQGASAAVLDTYGIQDASTIGIAAGDTIEALKTYVRMKRGGGGAGGGKAIQWRDNATDGYTSITATTSFDWYTRYDATMPADSGAWTQTRYNAFEVGANHGKGSSDAQDTFISVLWVMVAYAVSSAQPAITVSPTSYDFGVVAVSSTPSTSTTYFTIDNTSTMQTDQTIAVTTSTWSGGVTWTHSDTAIAGADTAGLKANKGGTWGTGDVIVKFTSPNFIAENQPASTNYTFGLKLVAPTSVTDGIEKSIIVRITAAAG